jgi:hypothetical protein
MQAARDEHELLEKFIGLMRELGKFPTANEVELKARSANDFPWHNAFARFGPKQQFAARIQDYCAERIGYDDVVALCVDIARTQPAPSVEGVESAETFGFVYLIPSAQMTLSVSRHTGTRDSKPSGRTANGLR